jgi:putative DNA primase/helicase
MVYAYRGVGKTWFCLMIALALTRKLSIGRWETVNPISCLYVDGEMLNRDMRDRISKLCKSMPEELAKLYILSAEGLKRNGFPAPNLTDNNFRKYIYRYLKSNQNVKVVILDNISSLAPGINENDKKDWDAINQWLLSLRYMGVSVILVHHAGKNGDQRGISSREDNLDVVINLKRPKGYRQDEGAVFEVEFTKARSLSGEGLEKFKITLSENEDGISWTTDSKKSGIKESTQGIREQVISLLGKGMKPKDICERCDCSAGLVSRYKKEGIVKGYLKKDCTFTEKGEREYKNFHVG